MEFTKNLIDEANAYLTKKSGSKAADKLTELFLKQLAELGILFNKHRSFLGKDS